MSRFAIVTGAGSGVGQAVAVRMASQGWTVGLIGRRPDALQSTRALLADPQLGIALPCDVADPVAVRHAVDRYIGITGGIDALVNAAGTNVAKRSLETLSVADFRSVIDVNLNGAFNCVHAVLPAMRQQHGTGGRVGTIVNVISDAGLIANATAGAAYVASKFGLTGLTQSINAEERSHGIRACAILPGEINTPLLDKRPSPPPHDLRAKMLQPQDLADCVMLAVDLPPRAIIEQLLIRPR